MNCLPSLHQPFVFLHSSSDGNPPYGDFHEKYISYKHETFRKRSVSFEEKPEIINAQDDEIPEIRYGPFTENLITLGQIVN